MRMSLLKLILILILKSLYTPAQSLVCRSTKRVHAINTMLRAQEKVARKNKLLLFHDVNGTLKQCFHQGNLGCDVWNDLVKLENCELHYDGTVLVNEDTSLYSVCLHEGDYGEFDPMTERLFFALTINKKESFILSSRFENTNIGIICISSFVMTIDHYDPSEGFVTMMDVTELLFNMLYTIEFALKIYCMSNVDHSFHDKPELNRSCCWKLMYYSKRGWSNYWRLLPNRFDFSICCAAWLNLLTESIGLDLAFIKILRIFRALRVTRVLRKVSSVKKIIDATANATQPVMNIL